MRWLLSAWLVLAGCAGQPMVDEAAGSDPDRVTHELTGTRWALASLAGEPVVLQGQAREPFIALESPASRVVGHAGCNRLTGSYTLQQQQLTFASIATTRMYCEQMALENDVLQALQATRRWRIDGERLLLLDEAGQEVASFLARNL